jgi:hypothetical protein
MENDNPAPDYPDSVTIATAPMLINRCVGAGIATLMLVR